MPHQLITLMFILFLDRRQHAAQDIQLLPFRARAGEQPTQAAHHLARMGRTNKAGALQRLLQVLIETLDRKSVV